MCELREDAASSSDLTEPHDTCTLKHVCSLSLQAGATVVVPQKETWGRNGAGSGRVVETRFGIDVLTKKDIS